MCHHQVLGDQNKDRGWKGVGYTKFQLQKNIQHWIAASCFFFPVFFHLFLLFSMKVLAVTFGLLASAWGAAAQLTAPTRNYNVSSPVSNGPYVAGQILPCTYQLFSQVDTSGECC